MHRALDVYDKKEREAFEVSNAFINDCPISVTLLSFRGRLSILSRLVFIF